MKDWIDEKTGFKAHVCFDLDGTLAEYKDWNGTGHIGKLIKGEALEKLWEEIADGNEVRIFTARASRPDGAKHIRKWLKENGLPPMKVTNVKNPGCMRIYDDRAVRVEFNTGKLL